MLKALGFVALLALSGCGAPAYAGDCVPTIDAVKMAKDNGLRPTIIRGKEMAPFVKIAAEAGSTGLNSATFIAVLKTESGAAIFFGNVKNTCGPVMIDGETYDRLMRPA